MPRSFDFDFRLIDVIVLVSRVFDWLMTPIARVVAEILTIAWPPPAAAFDLERLPASTEVIFAGRLRSRARAFEARRLQRDPLDLAAGCGLRLAA